jgi:hypothetical protein
VSRKGLTRQRDNLRNVDNVTHAFQQPLIQVEMPSIPTVTRRRLLQAPDVIKAPPQLYRPVVGADPSSFHTFTAVIGPSNVLHAGVAHEHGVPDFRVCC